MTANIRLPRVARFCSAWIIVALAATCLWSAAPQANVSPDKALQWLKEGNERFAAGKPERPNSDEARRVDTARNGQQPFAAVLACADSREPVEMLFDRGIGDLFVVRVAGNVSASSEVASLEYGAEHLGVPLIVVLGHTKCGAVAAAVDNAALHGSLPELIDRIKPAVAEARKENPNLSGAELLTAAIRANVRRSMAELLRTSETLRKLSESGKLQIVGGVYDIETGRVEWLPDAATGARATPSGTR
jgi:carbonic anhydrase